MDKQTLINQLQRMVGEAGTQKALAEKLGVSPMYLHDVLHDRREPGKAILDALNLERVVSYREKK